MAFQERMAEMRVVSRKLWLDRKDSVTEHESRFDRPILRTSERVDSDVNFLGVDTYVHPWRRRVGCAVFKFQIDHCVAPECKQGTTSTDFFDHSVFLYQFESSEATSCTWKLDGLETSSTIRDREFPRLAKLEVLADNGRLKHLGRFSELSIIVNFDGEGVNFIEPAKIFPEHDSFRTFNVNL